MRTHRVRLFVQRIPPDVTKRAAGGLAIALMLLVTSSCSSYRMGDPIKADAGAKSPATTAKQVDRQNAKEKDDLEPWEKKWREIQSPTDKVGYVDHFRVCAIKYRYRNYDELFRCLDLFEAKVALGDKRIGNKGEVERVRMVAPVLMGWLRASAYADLGQSDAALQSAESAWNALPERSRSASNGSHTSGWISPPDEKALYEVTEKITGNPGMLDDMVYSSQSRYGRSNPAGLDMRSTTIAMGLAAQRCLLYQHLGETAKSKEAFADLQGWEKVTAFGSWIPFDGQDTEPFKAQAQLLSLGPLFAMDEYAQVIETYESIARKMAWGRRVENFQNVLMWMTVIDKVFQAALRSVMTDPILFAVAVEDVSNGLIYAQSLARLGKTKEAREMLDTLLAMPELPAMGNLYWATLYERALIALKEGKRDEAILLLKQSTQAIESVRSTIAFEAAKIGFAGDKQAVYAALVDALAENGNWQEAFLVAERAKARSLVDLLAEQRDLAAPIASNEKVRDLLAQASSVADVGLPANEVALRSITVVADARTELATAAPEAASLIAVQSVAIADIAARMAPGESLIDYYRSGDDLYALVLNGTTVTGFKLSAKSLDTEVRAFRVAIEQRDPVASERGRALYDRLIRPLSASLTGNTLTISPHGALHYLPFGALMDGDQYLLDRFSLRLIPSASTLVYLKTDRPSKVGTLLALGNPDLDNASYDLPNAQVEAVNVAALFPASKALVRADASKTAIKELGSGFSMLHFATHGKFNSDDPLASGLYLAKGTEADGVLSVADLYTLRFDADLVTLSACETGLGKVANGDDVIGLTRGFLYAGARSIVASLWEVDDAATEQLMLSFYGNLQTHDKREALRLAQINTRANYPDPMYWAAFQIVGKAD